MPRNTSWPAVARDNLHDVLRIRRACELVALRDEKRRNLGQNAVARAEDRGNVTDSKSQHAGARHVALRHRRNSGSRNARRGDRETEGQLRNNGNLVRRIDPFDVVGRIGFGNTLAAALEPATRRSRHLLPSLRESPCTSR